MFIIMVMIPASQLCIRAKVNDYLGSSVGVELRYTNTVTPKTRGVR